MILAIGTKVKLKYTGSEGTVSELLGDGMVQVRLKDGDEIPVALEDLIRPEDLSSSTKAQIINLPKPTKAQKPPQPPIEVQYGIIKSMGIQLGFLPVDDGEGITMHYNIYLINDTRYATLFSFGFTAKGQGIQRPKVNDKLEPAAYLMVGQMPFIALNDLPEIELECWPITTAGTGERKYKKFKLRPKQFFGNVTTAPLLNKPVHHYRIFESFDESKEEKKEDLKSYTERKVKRPRPRTGNLKSYTRNEISEFANFPGEIDLHIENLTTKAIGKMSNAEILRIQIGAFENYFQKANQLGIDRIFIIHGLGKGKLRNEIATRLMRHPDVATFKNEYHGKYGYGATEVIFK